MSNIESLRITVNNVNRLMAELTGSEYPRIRTATSYGTRRIYLDEENNPVKCFPPRGPKECLMFAEGMEEALKTVKYGR